MSEKSRAISPAEYLWSCSRDLPLHGATDAIEGQCGDTDARDSVAPLMQLRDSVAVPKNFLFGSPSNFN